MEGYILIADIYGGPWDGTADTIFPMTSGQYTSCGQQLLIHAYTQTSSGQVGCVIATPSNCIAGGIIVTSGCQEFSHLHRIDCRIDYLDGVHFSFKYCGWTQGMWSGLFES